MMCMTLNWKNESCSSTKRFHLVWSVRWAGIMKIQHVRSTIMRSNSVMPFRCIWIQSMGAGWREGRDCLLRSPAFTGRNDEERNEIAAQKMHNRWWNEKIARVWKETERKDEQILIFVSFPMKQWNKGTNSPQYMQPVRAALLPSRSMQ